MIGFPAKLVSALATEWELQDRRAEEDAYEEARKQELFAFQESERVELEKEIEEARDELLRKRYS